MPDYPSSESSEREKIVEWLEANRGQIITRWMNAVAEDEHIPSSDRLTMTMLQDHFPEMLREIIVEVRRDHQRVDDQEAHETGAAHGKARWRHGYRLNEVLRELARIRELILTDVSTFCRAQISEKACEDVVQKIRCFFDAIVAASAEQFVEAQEVEVALRTGQLEHAYEQVQAATEQMRIISESRLRLLRAVIHELRNSLQPVELAARALREESNAVNRREIGRQLTGSAEHLQSLLDRLRELSGLLSGDVRVQLLKVDLAEFLREVEKTHRPAAEGKGLEFEIRQALDFPEIISDPNKLRKIAAHLVSNAIQFTASGFVHVETAAADGDRWIFRVSDSGGGIDPIDRRQIFDVFHRKGEGARSGLGLGLIFTRHLAHLLGGEVTFQSTFGKGSFFEVNLPRRMS